MLNMKPQLISAQTKAVVASNLTFYDNVGELYDDVTRTYDGSGYAVDQGPQLQYSQTVKPELSNIT